MSLSVRKQSTDVTSIAGNSSTRDRIARHEREIVKRICRGIDSPRSLACALLLDAGEFEQYLKLEIKPDHYDSSQRFADDYLVTECLKKSVAQKTTVDLEAVAYQKWVEAERQCAITNTRLEALNDTGIFPPGPLGEILRLATQFSKGFLGKLSARTLKYIEDCMDFGPGATLSVGGAVTRGRKFANTEPTTTSALLTFGLFCLPDLWKTQITGFKVEDENRLTFVPKNAKTHRAITIEADLNIYVQKGIGKCLRKRLSNFGLDLDSQWKKHHQLVANATKLNLATIDLSSASDTLAFETVKLFTTEEWFDLLCFPRPERTRYERGEITHTLEKFSGMGNGYTFELETLIFYSVLSAAATFCGNADPISAFGDDMICSNDIREYVIETLEYLGFKVNVEKSFGIGPFHESCGCDYFENLAVRPFYLRYGKFDHEEKFALFQYCNRIRRYAHNHCFGVGCDARFLPAWLYCFTSLKPRDRTFVAGWEYEDCGVVGNFDEASPSIFNEHADWLRKARKRGYSGYRFTVHRRPAVKTQRYTEGAYVSAVRQSSSFTHGREDVRGRTKPSVTRTAYVLHWPDLGPWI